MRTLILDGLFVYKDLPASFNNKRSIDIILELAKTSGIDRFILLQNGRINNVPDGVKDVKLKSFTVKDIIEAIEKESKSSDEVIVFNAASPFFDTAFVKKISDVHNKYVADYTYTVGYPDGAAPQIIRKDILKELIPLLENDNEIKKDYLFYAISKDINSFDIETLVTEEDLRIYRTGLGLADHGEEIFTENMYNAVKDDFSIDKLVSYIAGNIDKLFTVLYMLNLELTDNSGVSSLYLPQSKGKKNELDFNIIKKALEYFKKTNEKAYIVLGGAGEPSEHSQFIEIVKYIQKCGFDLIIESVLNKSVADFPDIGLDKEKLAFVIKQDAYYENTYKIVHPEGSFKDCQEKIKTLKQAGFRVYRQVVRMNENEVEIEKFVRNKEMDDVIIRKYSTFCGELPDKKVVDLSPLERIPCFHLRRELYIRADGTIPLCSYSRFTGNIIGDAGKDDFEHIISKLNDEYIKNVKKEYPECCKNCDDYYIFNF